MPEFREVSCPFCGLLKSGRYNTRTKLFTCSSRECDEFGKVRSYSEFLAEVDRQRKAFFEELPGLAPGNSRSRIQEIARTLLSSTIDPHLSLELIASWNEARAQPPMEDDALLAAIDSVAQGLRKGRAA